MMQRNRQEVDGFQLAAERKSELFRLVEEWEDCKKKDTRAEDDLTEDDFKWRWVMRCCACAAHGISLRST